MDLDNILQKAFSQAFGGVVLLIVGKAMGGSAQFAFDSSLLLMVGICAASIASFCIWRINENHELAAFFGIVDDFL